MKSNTRAIIERKIGYRFNNPDLLRQAFVRKSYANEHGGQHNEVLEHFGDAALNFAVKRYLFERYGSWTELSKDYNYRIDRNRYLMRENLLLWHKRSLKTVGWRPASSAWIWLAFLL